MTYGEGFVWVQYTSSLSHWSVITTCCTFHGPSSVAACAVAIPHPQFAWYGESHGPQQSLLRPGMFGPQLLSQDCPLQVALAPPPPGPPALPPALMGARFASQCAFEVSVAAAAAASPLPLQWEAFMPQPPMNQMAYPSLTFRMVGLCANGGSTSDSNVYGPLAFWVEETDLCTNQ